VRQTGVSKYFLCYLPHQEKNVGNTGPSGEKKSSFREKAANKKKMVLPSALKD